MNINQKEINRLARQANRLNGLLLKAISETETFVNDPIVRELINRGYEHQDVLAKMRKAINKLSKYDEFINVSTYESFFQDFDNFVGNIEDAKEIE